MLGLSRQGSRLAVAALAVVATLVGLLNFGVAWTSDLAERSEVSFVRPLVVELTGAWTVLPVLPFVLALGRRVPLRRERLLRALGVHLLGSMAFGASHTLLIWGTRLAVFQLLGWGAYDYGDMRYRFLMEYQKQAVLYALVLAVQALVLFVARSRERELAAAEAGRALAQARLEALRAQLEPHFLFNTLNLIASTVHRDPDAADAMIGDLADLLRATLRRGGAHEGTLGEERDLLEAYLSITRARFGPGLDVRLDFPDDTRRLLVPHLVLQPVVENAVRHGLADAGRTGHVRIAAAREGNRLRLTVEDDGPGIPGDPATVVGSGVGLGNTAERLRHLYAGAASLTLENVPGSGLRATIQIPAREKAP